LFALPIPIPLVAAQVSEAHGHAVACNATLTSPHSGTAYHDKSNKKKWI
jgi:hypothetical protein